MDERRMSAAHPRSSAPCARRPRRSRAGARVATSASVSVRSGARNRSENARLTRPGPIASERNVSNTETLSSRSPPASRRVRRMSPAGTVSATTNARSTPELGKARDGPCEDAASGRAEQQPEVELERDRAGVDAVVGRGGRRDLTDAADLGAVDEHARAAPRVEARPATGEQPQIGQPQRVGERLEPRDRVGGLEVAVGTERPVAHEAGRGHAHVVALDGQQRAEHRRREHRAQLEQRGVGVAARDVGAERGEQTRKQRGAQHRLLGAERVLDLDDGIERQPGRRDVGRSDQRQRERLAETGADEHVGDQAALALLAREPTDRRARRHRAGDVVEPVAATDLFDDVDLAREVGPSRRRRRQRSRRPTRRRSRCRAAAAGPSPRRARAWCRGSR